MVGSHGVRGCTTRGQLRSWSSGAHPGPPGPAPVAPHTSHDPSARLTLRVRRETNAIRCCDSQCRLPCRGAAAACGHGTTRQRQRLGVAAGGGGRRCLGRVATAHQIAPWSRGSDLLSPTAVGAAFRSTSVGGLAHFQSDMGIAQRRQSNSRTHPKLLSAAI